MGGSRRVDQWLCRGSPSRGFTPGHTDAQDYHAVLRMGVDDDGRDLNYGKTKC